MDKKGIFTIIGSGVVAGLLTKGADMLMNKTSDKHDPKLHPGEIAPGIFQIAGDQINFIDRIHNRKPMSDLEYNTWKDILKPHID